MKNLRSPVEMVAGMWRNRSLILAMTKREVLGRYKGSIFGLLWSFFNPLLMLTVYTFVFSEIFKARWNLTSQSKMEFALVLFVGLIAFNFFSECVNRAPAVILSNPNYVKKVVFPLEILPFVSVLSALFHGVISLSVWLVAHLIFFGLPPVTALIAPLIAFPLIGFTVGSCWILSSLGVYLRDVSQVIGAVVVMLMFLSPIFYPLSSVPEVYRGVMHLNPLTVIIEDLRAVLYWGRGIDMLNLAMLWCGASLFAWMGFAWFQHTRKGFADVL
ncbi:ABC transporter permease [Pseudorhodoferax sp.]|uniref:ABC transporter permease n=1 Tax=Pseudorhodoferax sp. TaxID=1993553 RepID=UPI0039E6E90B